MRTLNELLEEAKWGKLTKDEVDYVVHRIKSSTPEEEDDDIYTLLRILGKSGNKQYRKLVEEFLYYPTFPMVSSIALRTLCTYWGYAQDYLNELKVFIKGVEWDDGQVRLIAISTTGEFLRNHPEKELLQLLIDSLIVENKEENESIELYRDAAYEALARAVGEEWSDLLKDERPSPVVLEKVYRMLQTISSSNEQN